MRAERALPGRDPRCDAGTTVHARQWIEYRRAAVMDNPGIEDIARKLFEGLPEAARTMRRDIESNFRAVLQANLAKLDLTPRSEFDVQVKLLERTRARLEQMELRVATLEKRVLELEESVPPVTE
jgi:BMFP domain-containing protein YqiC